MELYSEQCDVIDFNNSKRIWLLRSCIFSKVETREQFWKCVEYLAQALFCKEEKRKEFYYIVYALGRMAPIHAVYGDGKEEVIGWTNEGYYIFEDGTPVEWTIWWEEGQVLARGAIGAEINPDGEDELGWLGCLTFYERILNSENFFTERRYGT
ncbi:MAG: hypothetical protein ACPLSY_03695 [Moorellaceae bacterium]